MSDKEIVDELIDILNSPQCPLHVLADRGSVLGMIDDLLSMYWELNEIVDGIRDMV